MIMKFANSVVVVISAIALQCVMRIGFHKRNCGVIVLGKAIDIKSVEFYALGSDLCRR